MSSLFITGCCLCIGGNCGAATPEFLLHSKKPSITEVFAHNLAINNPPGFSDPSFQFDDLPSDNIPGLKSPGKAMLLSFVVPGAGQRYAGAKTKSRIFFSAEAAAWVAFGGFKVWSKHKEKEFQGWAAQRAGIDPKGKPDDFWQMMTYYDSRQEYEIYGRGDDLERPSYPDLVGWDWQWDSDASRAHYRQLRNSAKTADRRATFSIGAMVINRVIAGIDAYRTAKSYNHRRAMEMGRTNLRLKGSPFGKDPKIMLVLEGVF